MNFHTNTNTPGYLPDNDPSDFDTFDEAKRGLIAEMLMDAEIAVAGEQRAEDLTNAAEDVNLWAESDTERTIQVTPVLKMWEISSAGRCYFLFMDSPSDKSRPLL